MHTPSAKVAEKSGASAANEIFELIRNELALVEAEFERQANSNVEVIKNLGEYIRSSGGKRVRPALTILSCRATGGEASRENVIRMATVMEMLHTATLVHDDIIDHAKTRRGRESIHTKFGSETAVLLGDWLYMSAFETSLKERSLEILDILTLVTRKMTEGEIIQLNLLRNSGISEDEYFDILRRKTAYLFSACCEIGGILGGSNAEEQTALRDYGMNLGIAFQIADDLLDFISDDNSLGKPSGADILEGKVTLPVIFCLKKKPDFRAQLDSIMENSSYDGFSREEFAEAIKNSGALESADFRAREFASAARKNLEVLPDSEYRSTLDEIASYVVRRSR